MLVRPQWPADDPLYHERIFKGKQRRLQVGLWGRGGGRGGWGARQLFSEVADSSTLLQPHMLSIANKWCGPHNLWPDASERVSVPFSR